MTRHIITRYTVRSPKIQRPHRLAVVADLHDGPYEDLMPHLREAEAVLIVGDLANRHRKSWDRAIGFLQEASRVRPVYYSIGNHEIRLEQPELYRQAVRDTDVTVLDGTCCRLSEDVALGGFSSQILSEVFDSSVVDLLEQQPGFRLMMCHHPEYYAEWIAGHEIDLTLSGHAHGGQFSFFGRGVFAPGQGIWPKWTRGFYFDRHLLVSRGLTNTSRFVPRIGVPCEMLMLDLLPGEV